MCVPRWSYAFAGEGSDDHRRRHNRRPCADVGPHCRGRRQRLAAASPRLPPQNSLPATPPKAAPGGAGSWPSAPSPCRSSSRRASGARRRPGGGLKSADAIRYTHDDVSSRCGTYAWRFVIAALWLLCNHIFIPLCLLPVAHPVPIPSGGMRKSHRCVPNRCAAGRGRAKTTW